MIVNISIPHLPSGPCQKPHCRLWFLWIPTFNEAYFLKISPVSLFLFITISLVSSYSLRLSNHHCTNVSANFHLPPSQLALSNLLSCVRRSHFEAALTLVKTIIFLLSFTFTNAHSLDGFQGPLGAAIAPTPGLFPYLHFWLQTLNKTLLPSQTPYSVLYLQFCPKWPPHLWYLLPNTAWYHFYV